MIHGIGKRPGKQRSIQVPIMIENILKTGKELQILEASNIWNSIHIDSVATGVIASWKKRSRAPQAMRYGYPKDTIL
jgi:hypothetical protein